MRGRKTGTELENLSSGLSQAQDIYQIRDLLELEPEELALQVNKEIRYSAISMIRAGRYFMAIKKKLEHGNWEDFVDEHRWNWEYVRCSMKLLEVTARFPQAAHLPAQGRALHSFLHLPMPRIHEVFDDLPEEAVQRLTPWDLEAIYEKKKGENTKGKTKPSRALPEIPDYDQELSALVITANKALLDISDLEIDPKHKQQALKAVRELALAWERAAYNLSDPDHKTTPRWEMSPAERALDGIGDEEEEASL